MEAANLNYSERRARFEAQSGALFDLAFLPLSADLQYLTGIPRQMPNFGALSHPSDWLEGAWIAPGHKPLLTLPRMTVEFSGGAGSDQVNLRIIDDHDDPAALLKEILSVYNLPAKPRIALSDSTRAQTVVALQSQLPDAQFSSASALLNPLRRVKNAAEIALMRKAGEITELAFAAVVPQLQHGITELEIMHELDFQLKWRGGLGASFVTSLYCSGPNHPLSFSPYVDAPIPSPSPTKAKPQKGSKQSPKPSPTKILKWSRELQPPVSILFDFGAVFEGYCYDFGRTVFFGQPPAEAETIHDLVYEAQASGIEALRAGATAESVDRAARAVIEAGGYGDFFRHRLGHSIGLDVHEAPFLTAGDQTILEAGMLFTIEPSIMQERGISARLEDVVLVTPDGGEALTERFNELLIID